MLELKYSTASGSNSDAGIIWFGNGCTGGCRAWARVKAFVSRTHDRPQRKFGGKSWVRYLRLCWNIDVPGLMHRQEPRIADSVPATGRSASGIVVLVAGALA